MRAVMEERRLTRERVETGNDDPMRIVILGLTVTSAWGNGHATTYRGLMRELAGRGHDVLFLERDMPWYAENRDVPVPPYGRTELYSSLRDLEKRFGSAVRNADLVIVGSYVPEGIEVGRWVLDTARGIAAFYDIDTPVTLAAIERGDAQYISADLIPYYRLYLSFTGGPILERLEKQYKSPMARALYCSADPDIYYPHACKKKWDIGYLGTYCEDRQPHLNSLMLEPARCWDGGHFTVAGPLYPKSIKWPDNVERIEYLPSREHRTFYNAMKFTMNITRADMVRAGYSPSVRLFEAASCATPIISDSWDGLDFFFEPGTEILVSYSAGDTLRYLREIPEEERRAIGKRARARILAGHTAAHRVSELEMYIKELRNR